MMKFLYLSGIFIALQISASAQLDQGLLGSYPLAGDAVNVNGSLDDGMLLGQVSATTDRFGAEGCALAFPGTQSDIVTIENASSIFVPTGAISVSLWYQGGTDNISDLERLFSKGDNEWFMGLYDMNRPLFGVGHVYAIWASNTISLMDTNWHHLVAVYNNSACSFYADGELQDTMDFELVNDNGEISLGRFYQGSIDDLRIYNRSLSLAEVQELYQLEGACSGATGIETASDDASLHVYPNPDSKYLFVENSAISSVEMSIIDVTGKTVYTANLPHGSSQINLSHLPNGIYTVLSYNKGEGTKRTMKIVVNH